MSRKDYERIAATIALEWTLTAQMRLDDAAEVGARLRALNRLALSLADVLAADSPRFDRERFLAAAMPR
jgi:hypothetical protein